jgi:hypothetical protein
VFDSRRYNSAHIPSTSTDTISFSFFNDRPTMSRSTPALFSTPKMLSSKGSHKQSTDRRSVRNFTDLLISTRYNRLQQPNTLPPNLQTHLTISLYTRQDPLHKPQSHTCFASHTISLHFHVPTPLLCYTSRVFSLHHLTSTYSSVTHRIVSPHHHNHSLHTSRILSPPITHMPI